MRPAARAQRVGGPRFAPLIHFHSVLLTVVLQWVNIRIAKEISWIPLFGDALTVLIRKRLVRLWAVFSRETEGKGSPSWNAPSSVAPVMTVTKTSSQSYKQESVHRHHQVPLTVVHSGPSPSSVASREGHWVMIRALLFSTAALFAFYLV
ncbi:hypothetical protein ABFA07_020182 [Porites harrisoni]